MFIKQMEGIADVLIEKGISKSVDKAVVVYGLSVGVELICNIITTLCLGFLFGLILESVVFLISFSFIRTYVGGYHCQKAINCYLMSNGIVGLILAIIKLMPNKEIIPVYIVLLIISIIIILKFAPVETITKTLDEKEQRHYYKKTVLHLGIECGVISILFLLGAHSLAFIVCLGIMVSAGLVFFQICYSKIRMTGNGSYKV